MGIDVRLENENAEPIGEPINDPANHFANAVANTSGSCLGFVDPYGNTVFNQLQLPVLIRELESLDDGLSSAAAAHVSKVITLLPGGLDSPHVYARFIGD